MEASSGKKVGENPQNETSHEASTKSNCHQLPQPTVDTGNNHDTDSYQLTELAVNFASLLPVSDLEGEIGAGSSKGFRSQPAKEMPTGDPKSVSPRGAGKQDSGVQQVGKPAEHSDYHHSLPLGQDTVPNLLPEDFREAKEVYFKKLQEENEDLKKVREKEAGEVEALQEEIEESSTRESEKNELIKKLQQMYQWKEGECNKLKEDLENQARQIEALENKLQDMEKETGQVEDLESKIESLEKKCETFKTDNDNLHQNAMFLVKELRERDIVSQRKQEIQNLEIKQLLEKSAAREDENNELIRKLVQIKQLLEESVAREDENNELIRKLEQDIQEQDQEILKGGESLKKQREELIESKKENEALREKATILEETLRKNEEKLNTVYQRMQQEIQNVEQYYKEAQDHLQTLKQHCDERAAIISKKGEFIDDLKVALICTIIIIFAYLFIHTPTYAPFDNL